MDGGREGGIGRDEKGERGTGREWAGERQREQEMELEGKAGKGNE